jgi:hypothetical protein
MKLCFQLDFVREWFYELLQYRLNAFGQQLAQGALVELVDASMR